MSYEPRRTPWHEDVAIRGLRHRLTWWGERSPDPIVLLHGFQDCGMTWQFLVDCLPASWTLVAPDWRGFGDSEWAPGGYWFPDYLADLEALLDRLTPNHRARVVGHSMGANVAQMYGGIRPQRLQWLANLEGLGLVNADPDEAPARYATWLDELRAPLREGTYESTEQLSSVLRRRNPRLTPERAQFIAEAWSRPTAAPGTEVRLRFDPRHRHVNPVLYRREEARACWSRFEIPVLLVMGELSGHRTRHLAHGGDEQLHALLKRLQIVTIPGVGHMMHHEDPQAVARHIIEFERTQAIPSPTRSQGSRKT
ncbi:MAG TPA: alpha/beta hydrolase [Steroidobacteraceae bacterium]|nr:alpha/beta hydrolase [Steroidobacteraceae bacterium]